MMEFTLREFIENIRKNGLPQTKFGLFQFTEDGFAFDSITSLHLNDPVIAACAVGQACINLNKSEYSHR